MINMLGAAVAVYIACRWNNLPNDLKIMGETLERIQGPINTACWVLGKRLADSCGLTQEKRIQLGLERALPRPPRTPQSARMFQEEQSQDK